MATREQPFTAPDSHERAWTHALTRPYALNWVAVAFAVILVLAVVTRFADLGARVMSHDESLHTYYSWRLYEYGEFSHTPLMHGPLLFHMTALNYFLFGDSDFTSRIYPALLGVLIVLFPALLRRWLGQVGAIFASLMLLISPELLYYNRYIRHDTPTIFFALVMIYAILQYLDGVRPRRPVWLFVMSGALLGMLASKEVAFIYIAIFGSFMVLFWLLRIVQDVGLARRPRRDPTWRAPLAQRLAGHLILLALTLAAVIPLGAFIRTLLSPALHIPSALWTILPLFLVVYLPLALSGLYARSVAGRIMQALAQGKSSLRLIVAGLILGALAALIIVAVIDVIKPEQVWREIPVLSATDQAQGANATKEAAARVELDGALFARLLTWVGLPTLALLFAVFLTAAFVFPRVLPLPWRDLLAVVLIALIVCSVLVLFERRSYVHEVAAQPFAADPTAAAHTTADGYDNTPIYAAWVLGVALTALVVATRLFTDWWAFLRRQPVFDVLIVIGTLILPWLAGFPLFWAGYDLEDYNPNSVAGRATLEAALPAVIPFLMLSIAIGLAWSWRRWLPAALVFLGLFAFFFTTVFSNQYGLVTGMIGSLGYWLEQQGVRRGSQPQYYYILTQLPVYEFLPLLGSIGAGIYGLTRLWRWRGERQLAERAAFQAEDALDADELVVVEGPDGAPLAVIVEQPDEPMVDTRGSIVLVAEDTLPYTAEARAAEAPRRRLTLGGRWPRLVRPWDPAEEAAHRAVDAEWIGAFPFLLLVGWWGIAILLGLTVAGEKMPWLTTHLTVPLILATGWWLGRVALGVRWSRLRGGGWLLLIALPLALIALAHVLSALWRPNPPFAGRAVEQLTATGNWLAALLVLGGAGYLIGRLGWRLGRAQLGRMTILAAAALLAVMTARVAFLASFVNYDYATEFLVYAHSGPAVKTVLDEVDRIAALTNEGHNMRIAFDDESSWPFTWYFRDYPNYGFLRGEAGSVDPTSLDGARVVVVGNKKAGDVRRILGDRYYEFSYIRLWWPMQEYFNLSYNKVANIFSLDPHNVAARYYRAGLFDIWWDRDYHTYGQAMCIESKQYRCDDEANWGTTDAERAQYRAACERAVVNECASDDRFDVSKWPVSDRMYVFVDKQIAAQVWDAGIGSSTVNIREPEYPEDRVYRDVQAEAIIGAQAQLMGPRDIEVQDGLLYIADTDQNRIAVLDEQGNLVRSIGQSGSAVDDVGLKQPWGVALGPDGNLYIADTWNNRVAVYTRDGAFVRAWGRMGVPGDGFAEDTMWGPRDVAIGQDGNLYLADTGGKRIRVYTLEGTFIRDIGSGGAGLGQLDEPVGLAFNPVDGHLYVAEAWNKRVQEFDPQGFPVRAFDVNMWFTNRQSFNRPYLAVNPDGTLIYVTDMDDRHRIVVYNLNGEPVLAFNQPDNLETGVLGLRSPAGLAFDDRGRLFVTDAELKKVFIFPPSEISGDVAPQAPDAGAPPAVEGPPGVDEQQPPDAGAGESGAAG